MGWQDEARVIIQELLDNKPDSLFMGGALGEVERGVKLSLALGIETIDKINEHQDAIEELQAGDVSIPIKIWEGVFNSGTLTPSTDPGHIPSTGVLADYNLLIIKFSQGSEAGTMMIPQALYSEHDSSLNLLNISKGTKFFNFFFNSAEELEHDSSLALELIQIWGIK